MVKLSISLIFVPIVSLKEGPAAMSQKRKAAKPKKVNVSRKARAENGRPKDFYIVGIGASAGGLDALEKFFRNMLGNSGWICLNSRFSICSRQCRSFEE